MMGIIKSRTLSPSASLLDAMKTMDTQKVKTLFVFDGERFEGLLTLGDIQRAIIKNIALTEPVSRILNKKKVYGYVTEGEDVIKEKIRRMRAEVMPILDEKGELVDVWFWSDLFKKTELVQREQINLPVVIMAGGKGTDVSFFEEDKPLGTIGSVALLKGMIDTPFFVSNCDIVIDQDMRDVYDYHCENHNDLTIVTAVKSFRIPYGVIETGEDGLMTALKEKPELTYMINTGVYILNSGCIDEIPQGEFFHITQLMEKIKTRGGRVGCFPVSEHAWKDMGEWQEYLKMINVL